MKRTKRLFHLPNLIALVTLAWFSASAQALIIWDGSFNNNDGSNGACTGNENTTEHECRKLYFGTESLVHTGAITSSGVVSFSESINNFSGVNWVDYAIDAVVGASSDGSFGSAVVSALNIVSGDFSFGTLTQITFDITFSDIDGGEMLTITQSPRLPIPMPEPSSLALVALAAAGLSRRKQKVIS